MTWRKWIVRGIVFGIIGAAATAAFAYQRWTNASAVREQVITHIAHIFPGAHVSVDSARLRILGGFQINGLRLTREDDLEKHEFLNVPSAIFYHDKEKILEGELTLRKIELMRPRLRVRRDRDGKWNLAGLLGPKSPGTPNALLPAIVIHQGTLILEDHADLQKTGSLEINDISLTIINDPIARIAIRGAANSDLLGKLHLQGSLDRLTSEAYLSFRATQIPLTQRLLERLPINCPDDVCRGLKLGATAHVEGKVSYHPSQPKPIYYDVTAEIENGKLEHVRLPLPLTDLRVKLHCNNGELQMERLSARSGTTELEAHGAALLPRVDQNFEVHLDLKHVVLGKELGEKLPKALSKLQDLFQPKGPTTVSLACAKHEGQWTPLSDGRPSLVSLQPEGISSNFRDFPYQLQNTTGKVDLNLLTDRVEINLLAHAGDRPVILSGRCTGEKEKADIDINIQAADVPIDEQLSLALKTDALEKIRAFADSFHATGLVDVNAHIRHEPGKTFRNEFLLRFHDVAMKWDQFPYPLTEVSGVLNIYPEHWDIKEFRGSHKKGQVHLNGKSIPKDEKGTDHEVSLEIAGHNIEFDEELHEGLSPMKDMHKAWDTFNPSGHLSFTASVRRKSADLNDLEVNVDVNGPSAKPTFFAYRVQDISGQFHFAKMRLGIKNLRAKHDKALIGLDNGGIDINPRGGYYADFRDLQINGMRFDEEFVSALPGKLQTAAKTLKLKDPLLVRSQVIIAQPPEQGKPPDVYWDGQVWLYNASFTTGLEVSKVTGKVACRGRFDGRSIMGVEGNLLLDQATLYDQPFKKVQAHFEMRKESPEVMMVGLKAPIYNGDVAGQIRVDFTSPLRYEMNLTASQINVAEFAQKNLGPKSQISGIANARLYLKGLGTGNGIDSLEGNGSIDLPHGHLYNLPFLLDLLKFLGLHWPDRTFFEEFHTAFSVQGSTVTVKRLDLLGSAVSLSGKGEFDLLKKEPKLDVYPMWGRIEQLLPPTFRPLPTALSKNLLTVEVRGKISSEPKDLKFQLKPMPVLVDPFLLVRDRIIGPAMPGNGPPPLLPPANLQR